MAFSGQATSIHSLIAQDGEPGLTSGSRLARGEAEGQTDFDLKHATITEQRGEVLLKKGGTVDYRPAQAYEVVKPSDIIRTGKSSGAELKFPDGTVCRLGAKTIFSFDPLTRDIAIIRGTAFVHVPPNKGGAQILTPAATARLKGDTVVLRASMTADGIPVTNFTALSPHGGPTDGNIVVTLNRNPRISFPLDPAHVAIVPQNAISLAKISRVEIDVGTFVAHSAFMRNLPGSAKLEVNAVSFAQNKALASGVAQRTGSAVVGHQVLNVAERSHTRSPSTAAQASTPKFTSKADGKNMIHGGAVAKANVMNPSKIMKSVVVPNDLRTKSTQTAHPAKPRARSETGH